MTKAEYTFTKLARVGSVANRLLKNLRKKSGATGLDNLKTPPRKMKSQKAFFVDQKGGTKAGTQRVPDGPKPKLKNERTFFAGANGNTRKGSKLVLDKPTPKHYPDNAFQVVDSKGNPL